MNPLIKKTAFKLYHNHIKKDAFFKKAEIYNSTQFWGREKILDYQWGLFKGMLDYAYHRVPYYREIFDKKGITPSSFIERVNLTQIPILTKDIVNKNFDKLIAVDIEKSRILKSSTSGSSGTNFNFLIDTQDKVKQVLQKRCYEWMGIDHLDKKMTIWGASWDVKRSKELTKSIKAWVKGWVILSGYNLSDQDIENYYRKMLSFRPRLIISYPSILYQMAEVFEKKGFEYVPHAIQIGGEKLFPFQREKIEKVFKTKVFDFYGARDMRLIAQECDHHNGLHVMAENVLVEVVDDDGKPLKEGEGDLVITDLHNKVMPFIRYKNGDRAIITQEQCSCGRGLPMLKEIIGRSFEILEFPNGNRVGGSFWTLVMRSEPGVQNFQVIQKSKEKIEILFTANEGFNKDILERLKSRILHYSGNNLSIEFVRVDNIPLTKGGKFRFVISEVANEKSR